MTSTTLGTGILLSNSTLTNAKNGCYSVQSKFQIVQEQISIVWLIFGTIGNLLSLFVLLRRKMRIHSTFTYLMLLSICDTLVIYIGLLRDYLVYKYSYNITSKIACKIHVFSFYFLLHMASWLLVAVNIDRLIASSFLSFSKLWCTPRKALCVSLFIAFTVIMVDGHFLYYVDSKPVGNSSAIDVDPVNPFVYSECVINKRLYKYYSYFFQNIFTWIDTTTQVILPFIIMIICNCNIIYKVLLTKKKTKGKNMKRLRKIKGMCIMILTVSIVFFILELPVLIFICLMQGEWISPDSSCNEFLFIITNLMMYTNHVINFVSYCMTGTKFRRELIRMLNIEKLVACLNLNQFINKNNVNALINNNNATNVATHGQLHNASNLNNMSNKTNNNANRSKNLFLSIVAADDMHKQKRFSNVSSTKGNVSLLNNFLSSTTANNRKKTEFTTSGAHLNLMPTNNNTNTQSTLVPSSPLLFCNNSQKLSTAIEADPTTVLLPIHLTSVFLEHRLAAAAADSDMSSSSQQIDAEVATHRNASQAGRMPLRIQAFLRSKFHTNTKQQVNSYELNQNGTHTRVHASASNSITAEGKYKLIERL